MKDPENLDVHVAKNHEGRCNFCNGPMPVWTITSTRPEGGLVVRFCIDCLDEAFRKTNIP